MRGAPEDRAKEKSRRLELSVAQVAGSAVAAVGAAVLASKMGVYGTILGAGVVSVVATAGGTLVQHLFRRTGEQLKEVTAQTRPRTRVGGRGEAGRDGPPPLGVYGEPTTHGTTVRGWKRSLLGAGAVFLIAMAAITGIEAFSGGPVSNVWGGDSRGTTVGNSVHSTTSDSGTDRTPAPSSSPSGDGGTGPSGEETTPSAGSTDPSGDGTRHPSGTPSPSGSGGHGGGSGESGGATSTPTPAPTPSGGDTAPSGQEDQGEQRDQRGAGTAEP